MHSKRRYKICICSVILGERESFRNFQYYFPANFRCNSTFRESEDCSDAYLHHIFEFENFGFSFFVRKIA